MYTIEIYKLDEKDTFIAVIKNNLYKYHTNNGYDINLFYLLKYPKKIRLNVIEENNTKNELYKISYFDTNSKSFKRIIINDDQLILNEIKSNLLQFYFSKDILQQLITTNEIYYEYFE